jgi:hypothetical protein
MNYESNIELPLRLVPTEYKLLTDKLRKECATE